MPSEDKHTPGPWDVTTDLCSHPAAVRKFWHGGMITICYISSPGGVPGPEKTEQGIANARLIAAAPDMLAALKLYVESCGLSEHGTTAWIAANSAIFLAKYGRSQEVTNAE